MRTAAEAADLHGDGLEPVGLHDLRHSLVAIAFEQELTPPEIAELARHANAKVTLTVYGGLTGDGREKAVAKLGARVICCGRRAATPSADAATSTHTQSSLSSCVRCSAAVGESAASSRRGSRLTRRRSSSLVNLSPRARGPSSARVRAAGAAQAPVVSVGSRLMLGHRQIGERVLELLAGIDLERPLANDAVAVRLQGYALALGLPKPRVRFAPDVRAPPLNRRRTSA